MKNKISDVRNHLVGMMEELGDMQGRDVDDVKAAVARATAMSTLATTYISGVRVEMDALVLADSLGGKLPQSIDQAPAQSQAQIKSPTTTLPAPGAPNE